ncbi:MAG: response regulator [Bryobacteraceae bacterium]|jgi:DNA-binding NtrC family response regulator
MGHLGGEILIVDDEGALLRLMSEYLRRLGFVVTPASTMAKAWEYLKAQPERFAAVVLDAGVADTGIDDLVLEVLALHSSLRVVVNSGYPVDMSVLRQAAPGRVEFLHKPFSPDMLVAAMRRMLGPQEEEV